MRSFSASTLLEIWERGLGYTPVEQALVILTAAFPQASRQVISHLTVAQRDVALFHLRAQTFGTQFKGLADCPACNERLELVFDAHDLGVLGLLPEADFSLDLQVFSLRIQGYQIDFRLPTSVDLLAILASGAMHARQRLLEVCIVSAKKRRHSIRIANLPPEVIQTLSERIGQQAALANLTISAICPVCDHRWEIIFDIVSYFWNEINAWATRMMHEIHLLASTYGWSEADILTMSAWRRQRYLEMIGIL